MVVKGLDREAQREAIETHKKQADAKVKAAISEYLAAHPECSEEDISRILCVSDEEAKQMVLRLLSGERPGELLDASSIGEGTE